MKINVAMPDTYALRARLIPAIVAGAPAFALAAILISWTSFNFTQFVAAIGLTALFSVFNNVARQRGKAIEPALYEKMGGMPSIVMLRHSDNTFDAVTKAKMHAFLAQTTARLRRACLAYAPGALDRILHYAWPGNIRELAHAVVLAHEIPRVGPVGRAEVEALPHLERHGRGVEAHESLARDAVRRRVADRRAPRDARVAAPVLDEPLHRIAALASAFLAGDAQRGELADQITEDD